LRRDFVSDETKIIFMGITQKVGSLGEELVVKFLMKRGHKILVRNYRRPWGELDIVSERKGRTHFVEVKTLSGGVVGQRVTPETSFKLSARETASDYIKFAPPKDWFRPEDHVNRNKMKRLSRIIQTYLNAKRVSSETNWQFDVATVLIDTDTKKAKINLLEDIIL